MSTDQIDLTLMREKIAATEARSMDLRAALDMLIDALGARDNPAALVPFGLDARQAHHIVSVATMQPTHPMQLLHLVWNPEGTECVGFLNYTDAVYTASGGGRIYGGVTTLGYEFRDLVCGHVRDRLHMATVAIPK